MFLLKHQPYRQLPTLRVQLERFDQSQRIFVLKDVFSTIRTLNSKRYRLCSTVCVADQQQAEPIGACPCHQHSNC